ncbi:membrane-spanning 4-domains subfamily A member 13 [Trichechus manatus latirostris]|uniref:Membrane-spanning 4-domains subfamily A member 13 n=1 Tax=Trichechus manatus latirostris TaxID=127582 RepID=A0A2Y9E8T3_TRIMA|nr:membrane-spanning 4-domains subfamily A member 13 [Trichechus manatus latirostris]
MIGIFHVFMWYFVMFLYMGQIQGVFGIYEPLTYKTGCALWGVIFILSGIFIIRKEKHPSHCLVACALSMNILSTVAAIIALILTVIELSQFHSVSYRNYGQAKLGREVSRILLVSYHLEISIAFIYSLFTCIDLVRGHSMTPAQQRKGDISVTLPPHSSPRSLTGPAELWGGEGGGRRAGAPLFRCPRGSPRAAPHAAALLATTAALEPNVGDEGHG